MKREDVAAWLDDTIPHHRRLRDALIPLIESLLKHRKIEFLSVTGRVKSVQSAADKVKRKGYLVPSEQMTDLTGIRIVTYFDSQVRQISNIIRDAFSVDEHNSLDRAALLGMDRMGYRSVHFVCTLGARRAALPEFAEIGELKFEIQVRTVLQHAWAELAHDRAYKFPGVLPSELQRQLNLYSGMLEIADSAFDEIAAQVDKYKNDLVSGNLTEISSLEIDSINLKKMVDIALHEHGNPAISGEVDAEIVDELKRFGVSNVGQFSAMLGENSGLIFSGQKEYTYPGVIRDAMLLVDFDKYFSNSWQNRWGSCDTATINRLNAKYPDRDCYRDLREFSIHVYDDVDGDIYDEESNS